MQAASVRMRFWKALRSPVSFGLPTVTATPRLLITHRDIGKDGRCADIMLSCAVVVSFCLVLRLILHVDVYAEV